MRRSLVERFERRARAGCGLRDARGRARDPSASTVPERQSVAQPTWRLLIHRRMSMGIVRLRPTRRQSRAELGPICRSSAGECDDSHGSVDGHPLAACYALGRVTGSDHRRDAVLARDDGCVCSECPSVRDNGSGAGEQWRPCGGRRPCHEDIPGLERGEVRGIRDEARRPGGDPGARGLADDGVQRDRASSPGSFYRASDRIADEPGWFTDREWCRHLELSFPSRSPGVRGLRERVAAFHFAAVEEEHLLGRCQRAVRDQYVTECERARSQDGPGGWERSGLVFPDHCIARRHLEEFGEAPAKGGLVGQGGKAR